MNGDKLRGVGREVKVAASVLHLELVKLVLPVLFPEIELPSAGSSGAGHDHAVWV